MLTGLTSSTSEELDRLRQRYEQLCDLVTRTAEADPDAAERVLTELQEVSEQLLVLEAAGDDADSVAVPAPHEDPLALPGEPFGERIGEPAADPLEEAPSAGSPPVEAPVPTPPAMPAAMTPQMVSPQAVPPRVVAFPVAPSVAPRPAPLPSAPRPAGPQPASIPDLPTKLPFPDVPPTAEAASPAAAHPGPAQRDSATLFSAAIRQWLERRRDPSDITGDAQNGTMPPRTDRRAMDTPAASPSASAAAPRATPVPPQLETQSKRSPAEASPAERSPDLARVATAVEQQAVQIERILALCEAHQIALEQLDDRIEARLAAARQVPEIAGDPELPDLRAAVEEQRQRVTALAKTIHNLAQWLAAQRSAPGR